MELLFVSSDSIHYTFKLLHQSATHISVSGQNLPYGVQLQIRQCSPSRGQLGRSRRAVKMGVATVPSPFSQLWRFLSENTSLHLSTVCATTTTSGVMWLTWYSAQKSHLVFGLWYNCDVPILEMGDIHTNYSQKKLWDIFRIGTPPTPPPRAGIKQDNTKIAKNTTSSPE